MKDRRLDKVAAESALDLLAGRCLREGVEEKKD